MAFDNRESVVKWLNDHTGQRICLTSEGSTLRVVGETDGVERLDACSMEILHSELQTDIQGVQIAMSLHLDALALHLLGTSAGNKAVVFAVPLRLPYASVRLSLAGEDSLQDAHKGRASASKQEGEAEYSPYELLFTRSD